MDFRSTSLRVQCERNSYFWIFRVVLRFHVYALYAGSKSCSYAGPPAVLHTYAVLNIIIDTLTKPLQYNTQEVK